MVESFSDKSLGDVTAGEFELILTRAMCRAFRYGAMRWQIQMARPFEAHVVPVTHEEASLFAEEEIAFIGRQAWPLLNDD